MQKMTPSTVFHAALIVGLLLIGGGVYLVSQQVRTVSETVRELEGKKPTATSTSDQPTTPSTERQLLTIQEAERRLMEFDVVINSGNWNTSYDIATLQAEPLELDNGRTLHVPYDIAWGNDQYQLDTFEVVNGDYIFGPMHANFLFGAYRDGFIRVRESRSLNDALADPAYSTENCNGDVTFKPAKVKVKNVDAVRYEGEACEGAWVGYEIRFGTNNLILVTGPQGGEDLLKFVLERM